MMKKEKMKKIAILFTIMSLSLAACSQAGPMVQNESPAPVAGVNRYYHTDDGNYKIPGIERIKSIRTEQLYIFVPHGHSNR